MKISKNLATAMMGIFILSGGTVASATSEDIHEEVQAAMNYELPENICVRPKSYVTTTQATGAALPVVGGLVLDVAGTGSREVSDVDSVTIRRLKRKDLRWEKCVSEFKNNLLDDMETLKASAQYGITQDQATIILEKMAEIQKVYMTYEGVLEETQP